MKTVFQRMVWNTRGWVMPSGNTDEKGFPAEQGYGYEEWNFQREDAYEGNVYGYMMTPPASAKIKPANGVFRIIFFTIHPITKERLAVGIYHKAKLASANQSSKLIEHFNKEGIVKRRAIELQQAILIDHKKALKAMENIVHALSVYCHLNEVESFSKHIPIKVFARKQNVSDRFSFTYLTTPFKRAELRSAKQSSEQISSLCEDGYYRETDANLKVVIPRHNQLSNEFCAWLKKQHKITAIQEKQRVDIKYTYDGRSVLAELKVCYGVGTTKAIREALGQLLEYNHYPERIKADLWIIILDLQATDADCRFIDALRDLWKLPITLGWKIKSGFSFHPALSS